MDTSCLLFVSHSHQDDSFCLRLIADLRANLGEDAVWYDTSGGLHGGDNWWNRIIAEITERPYFLVVLSPHASESKWVPEEMAIAYRQKVELGKRLLPVRLADSPRREDWKGVQEFDFTQPDNPARYAATLAELLHAIVPTLTEPVVSAPSVSPAPIAPERQLSPTERLAQETHTAYGLEHWSDVLDKTQILIERNAMTPVLWRERASAAFAIGDNNGGLAVIKQALTAGVDDADTLLLYVRLTAKAGDDNQAVEILTRAYALASFDDITTRLAILDELIAALARLKRWDEFTRRMSDARRVAPDDPRWALHGIEQLLGTGQYNAAITTVRALPTEIDATPLLLAWHTAISTAMNPEGWNQEQWEGLYGHASADWTARRALLEAAPSIGATPSIVTHWRRFDFAHFAPQSTLSHSSWIGGVSWSPNGDRIATACGDGTAKIWDAASGRLTATLAGYSRSVSDVAWSPDGTRIAVAADDEIVLIWDAITGRLLATLPSRSSGLLATSNIAKRLLESVNGYYPGMKREVAWSPDGLWIATTSGKLKAQGVQVWEVASGRPVTMASQENIDAVAWSPESAYLAISGGEGTKVWEVASGRLLTPSDGKGWMHARRVAWSPDGARIAGGKGVWEVASMRHLTSLHTSDAALLAWAPDGIRLASGSNRAQIWDATNGRLLTTLVKDTSRSSLDPLSALAWSPDGARLATAESGAVIIWSEE